VTADEQVIEGILQQIETAWNRFDSVSLAAVFARMPTSAAESECSAARRWHGCLCRSSRRCAGAPLYGRPPDAAVVFSRAHVKFKEGNEGREIETRPTLIVVKENGKWQIVAFQNTRISEVPAAAQAAARLAT
jgi:hypothetical protein